MNRYLVAAVKKLNFLSYKRIKPSAILISTLLDKTSSIRQHCRIYNCNIERYSYICRNCLIQNTKIGSFCSISQNCNIGAPSHPTDFVSSSPVFLEGKNYLAKNFSSLKYEDSPPTVIGNDVWIGSDCLIKAGITIGDGAIIGMGSVVTHDVPPYEIWAGNPAKLIRKRFDDETIKRLLKSKWWDLTDHELKKIDYCFDDPIKFLEEVGNIAQEKKR